MTVAADAQSAVAAGLFEMVVEKCREVMRAKRES
jgi:hypothetical protein